MLTGLLDGFAVAFTPNNLFFCFIGVFTGTLIGVLPGIGPVGAMAILLSMTFGMDPSAALIMFAGIYYGSMYGGSTTSILLNIPGEATSVVTAIDGHKMAQKGRGGAALFIAAAGSFMAGTLAIALLMLFTPVLAGFALKFGAPEYAVIAFCGFVILTQMSHQPVLKTLIMIAAGLMVSTVGMDPITGQSRFTFGTVDLIKGIEFIPVIMGLYGIAEVLEAVEKKVSKKVLLTRVRFNDLLPNREELRRSVGPSVRGSILGFFTGLIPGPSAIISTFMSYTLERKLSRKHADEFGKGAPEGVAGPESANNAAAGGAFVPVLALGIPFAPPTALLLSALLIHGITPGPLLIKEHPDLFWSVIASMYIGNIMLLILNLPLIGMFINILRTPQNLLMPLITVLCIVGAYAIDNSVMDVWVMIVAGVVGYVLRKSDFDVSPMVLAMVIGPMLENSFRQTLLLSEGSLAIFFRRPVCLTMLVVVAVLVALQIGWNLYKASKNKTLMTREV